MRYIFVIVILSISFNLYSASGVVDGDCHWETGDQINESIEAVVEYKDEDGRFSYKYTMKNLEGAKQNIWKFILMSDPGYYRSELIGKVIIKKNNSELPSYPGHIKEHFEDPSFKKMFDEYLAENKKARIYLVSPVKAIKPGEVQVLEFYTTELGMPSIIEYYAEGEQIITCHSYASPEAEFIDGYHNLTPYGPGKVGYTIGPGLFSENVYQHISEIRGELEKASKLKWIKDKKVYDRIKGLLNEYEVSYNRGINKIEKAKEIIKAIDGMRKSGEIKDELFYLLKAHIEYISKKR